MESFFKFLLVFLPFVKEMLFGEDKITEVVRKNKVATVLFFANIVLFLLLTYMSSEAISQHWKVKAQEKELAELKTAMESIIPAGDNKIESIISIGKRIATLERDKVFTADRLHEAYDKIEELAGDLEECKTSKPVFECRTRKPPVVRSEPVHVTKESEPVVIKPTDAKRVKRLLDSLKEE